MNQCYITWDIPADMSLNSGSEDLGPILGCMTVRPDLVKAFAVETEHVRTRDWITARWLRHAGTRFNPGLSMTTLPYDHLSFVAKART